LREQDGQSNSLIKHSDDAILWDLRLNPATPMRLTIATDVGNGTIDLSQLHITDLDLTTSVGSTTLTLPRQGQVQANVRSGVGNLTIRIPEGVAVRIESSAGLGAVSVSGDYRRQGDVCVSPDFETAANRIDLHATSGIGGITIQPWVASVVDVPALNHGPNGATDTATLEVRVTDAGAAEAHLLRLILEDPQMMVIEFGRTQHNLEAIFMEIVEGGNPHGNHS
jgi:hypothetical protein